MQLMGQSDTGTGPSFGGTAALSGVTIHNERAVPWLNPLPPWLHRLPAIVQHHTASRFCGSVQGQLLLMASVLVAVGGSRDAVGVWLVDSR